MTNLTDLTELNKLVAQQLGWVQVTLPSYQGECIQPYVPPEVAKLTPKEAEDWLFQWKYWNEGELNPPFSTDYDWCENIFIYCIKENNNFLKDYCSKHCIYNSITNTYYWSHTFDSIKMCLDFLKYKGVNVKN